MRKQLTVRYILLIAALLFILAACRRARDDTPTAVPTAAVVATVPAEATEPPATPTAEPAPITGTRPEAIDWAPQVVYSSPQPGEEVALNGAITIRFDQPMDQESVEEAFVVEPADDSGAAVPGSFTWTRPDTVVFTPRTELRRQQNYRVHVGETATSQNGQSLIDPLDIELQTVGFLDVSQTVPPDDADSVQTDSAITVIFNRPVVPLVSTGQQANLPQPLTISPAVEGEGEWLSTSIYRFVPAEPLAGATSYQVTVESGLTDVTGGVLAEDITWNFTTLNPSVVSVTPESDSTSIRLTTPITVTFNMPMDTASTEAAVSLRAAGAAAPAVGYEWQDNNRVLVLTPQEGLQLGTEYQVVIAGSAQSASGEATLDRETVSTFTTVLAPAVTGTMPERNATADRWQYGFTVFFASPMDLDTLEGRIRIEPAPNPNQVSYYFNEFDLSLYVSFTLERNTEYTVTIPGDAADPYGNTLGQDYTWSFRTPNHPPVASFNLPTQVSQLSTSFPTTVEVIHRNVSALNVSLYNLGLPLNLIGEPYTVNEYRPSAEPVRRWSLPLERDSREVGLTPIPLAEGGVLPTGIYLVTVNAPEVGDDSRFWQNQRNLVMVADTNIVVKEMFGEVRVWVTDLASGQPAQGRNLTLYNRMGVAIGTAVSDANGFAVFPYEPTNNYLEGVAVVSNEPGQAGFGVASSLWNGNISPWQLGLSTNFSDEAPIFAYLYTDRPIYRPGDTVYYKGIVRDSHFGRYSLPTQRTLEVQLSTIFYTETPGLSDTFTVTLDEEGTFSGEFVLPDDVDLGTYQLYLTEQDFSGYRTFTVAEYRAPEFLVNLTADREEALRGEPVEVTLEAVYFFGGPVTDAEVQWTVYAQAYSPDVPGPYYAFGDTADFFYESVGPFNFGGAGGMFGEFVTNGIGRTDSQGRLVITLPADLLEAIDEGSRRVTVEATLTDLATFPVTSRTTVILHAADTYVGVIPSDYAATAGREVSVNLRTVDWSGQARPNQAVEVVFYRRDWQRSRENQFSFYYTEWTPIDTEITRVQATTDAQGRATASFTPQDGGSYLAVATVTDDNGRTHTSSTYIWAIDPDFAGWRTDPKSRSMELAADQQEYRPGDTARVLVQSPFDGPVQAWLVIERGTVVEQRVVTLQTSSEVLEIPITPMYAPNVFVSVIAVKGVEANDPDNPYADIRIGITELVVSPEQLALDISLTPRESNFAPGETAVYDIRVTDYQGQPVQAELSLALVDLAVLTLKEDNAPPILEAFYARQPYRSQVGAGLFVTGEGLEAEIPLEGGGGGGGGGDGVTESALRQALDDETRRDFPDTAYWEAKITTDENGEVTVEIPLPDSLTTWRLSSKAVTTDSTSTSLSTSLVGQSSVDVMVSLPLLIRPVTPRFFTVGDVIQLGAIVNNNTGAPIEATVMLEADGLTLVDDAEQTITVPANGQQLVRWEATVDDVPAADLTFRVSGGEFRDATKPTFGEGPDNLIPVYRYTGEDVVGTSGVLAEAGRRVEAILLPEGVDMRQGSVDVTLSPSLAAALLDALEALNEEEYMPVCAHAVTDRLLPNVATMQAIRQLDLDRAELESELDGRIQAEIDQLESLVKEGGGWGWCYSAESNPWISAYALFALVKAQQAGYTVDDAVLSQGTTYLNRQLDDAADLNEPYEVNRQAFFLYVLAEQGNDVSEAADDLFSEHRALLAPYARAYLALAYELSGAAGNNQQALLADLNDSAVLSATGAHWESGPDDWRNLGSDVRGTAIVVDALARLMPDNELTPQAVRWLMVARTAAHWRTGHETAWTISALTDWMTATGELDADFSYGLDVNTATMTEGTFTRANITENEQLSVPLRTLAPDEVNFLNFQRGAGDGRLYYTAHLDSFIDMAQVEPVSRGITVQRVYYDADCDPEAEICQPIDQVEVGQRVRVELTIIAHNDLLYARVEDPIPSGAEAVDPGLATSASDLGGQVQRTDEGYRPGYWGWWVFNRIEYRDDRVVFLAEFLPAGSYQYTYFLQTNIPGEFQVMPTTARQEFFPEVFGRSDGLIFTIAE